MKPNKTYLKGKSVFIVSLIVIVVTTLTVYASGIHFQRSITSNFYISLGIIAATLFSFLAYGLYKGIALEDDFPKLKSFTFKSRLKNSSDNISSFEGIEGVFDIGEGIGGIIGAIIMWIVVSVVFVLLLVFLEAVFVFSLSIILAMLYWLFFRAMRLVFSKGVDTEQNLQLSIVYALSYTTLYVGWLFGIVYATTLFN